MIVEVKSLGERTYMLEVDPDATVLHCKHLLEPMVADGSDASRYTLVHLGNVLGASRGGMTLAELGFKDGEFLVLIISASERAARVAEAQLAAQQAAAAKQAAVHSTEQSAATPAAAQSAAAQSAAAQSAAHGGGAALSGVEDVEDVEDEVALADLIEMGFPREQALAALTAAFGNRERAVEYLFGGIPDDAPGGPMAGAPMAPTPRVPTSPTAARPLPTPPFSAEKVAAALGGAQPRVSAVLSRMRSEPQLVHLARLAQQNPPMVNPLLQELSTANPTLLRLVNDNMGDFHTFLRAPGG